MRFPAKILSIALSGGLALGMTASAYANGFAQVGLVVGYAPLGTCG
jgi:hypothetical protein